MQIINVDQISGELLIKETYSGTYLYKKYFILKADGTTEKYRGRVI